MVEIMCRNVDWKFCFSFRILVIFFKEFLLFCNLDFLYKARISNCLFYLFYKGVVGISRL